MASPTWWTWVWASSGSWWWTGKQRVGHNRATELNSPWTGNPNAPQNFPKFSFKSLSLYIMLTGVYTSTNRHTLILYYTQHPSNHDNHLTFSLQSLLSLVLGHAVPSVGIIATSWIIATPHSINNWTEFLCFFSLTTFFLIYFLTIPYSPFYYKGNQISYYCRSNISTLGHGIK